MCKIMLKLDEPSDSTKKCACKGIRRCLFCDANPNYPDHNDNLVRKTYIYCAKCKDKAVESGDFEAHWQKHSDGQTQTISDENDSLIPIDGVFLQADVITEDEELELIKEIDSFKWVESQSGRRKQDFGPKCNFKKRKVNFSNFIGLPKLDVEILDKIINKRLHQSIDHQRFAKIIETVSDCHNLLNQFVPVEICHLEYCPERGSSIDPHFDDFWIWGERLVTLNLLSTAILTLTIPESDEYCIRIVCPPKSILILYGDARNQYHHAIKRADIKDRRLAITYRELPMEFFDEKNHPDKYKLKEELMKRAQNLIKSTDE